MNTMATIKKRIDVNAELTEEQLNMLKKAEEMSPSFDEDNPPLTKSELKQFKRVSDVIEEERKSTRKQNVTLRLSPSAVNKAKSLGKGYTSILAKIIEKALDNPDITELLMNK